MAMSCHFLLLIKSPSELTEIGVKKSMKNQNIKKNQKNQKNQDKSSNGAKRTNQNQLPTINQNSKVCPNQIQRISRE